MNLFREYAELQTSLKGNATKKSGKADSYTRYLIQIVIFHNEIADKPIDYLLSSESYLLLEKIKDNPHFKSLNENSGYFHTATLRCLKSYIVYVNSQIEEPIDDYLNATLKDQELEIKDDLRNVPEKRGQKDNTTGKLAYRRNKYESLSAKQKNNWQCELDVTHTTFQSKNDKPYMDAHHLIPMAAQDFFENTIDFADNIVCLCPTCHCLVHHASDNDKKVAISKLFSTRASNYPIHGIEISLDNLLSFYGV